MQIIICINISKYFSSNEYTQIRISFLSPKVEWTSIVFFSLVEFSSNEFLPYLIALILASGSLINNYLFVELPIESTFNVGALHVQKIMMT